MLLNPREYLAELERAGLHSPSSPVPEHTAAVWNTFLELYDSHIGSSCDIELVVTPSGLGFYRDPLDAESDIYTWALTGALCHPILPFSPAQLESRDRRARRHRSADHRHRDVRAVGRGRS
jgi:hypothetical protein